MIPYTWKPEHTAEEAKNGAYWERNMLALYLAFYMNGVRENMQCYPNCGWYLHGEWEGWSRVISIADGAITFHIPDDFEVGNMPQIEPNWDGHSTEEKWIKVMENCGIVPTLTAV